MGLSKSQHDGLVVESADRSEHHCIILPRLKARHLSQGYLVKVVFARKAVL